MARPKSVYLTDRTMSALRGDEALSGRINQIVDRYLQLMASYQNGLRAEFDESEWERLRSAYAKAIDERKSVNEIWAAMMAPLDDDLAQTVDALTIAELVGLFELIEADAAAIPSATQSS